jgi:methyl-accepting chemotaxis protein
MEFRHLGFPQKLMLGYLLGILVLALLFSMSIMHISSVFRDYDNSMKHAWRQLYSLQNLRSAGFQIRLNLDNTVQIKKDLQQMDAGFESFLEHSRKGELRDMVSLVREYYSFRKQALKLVDLKEGNAAPATIAAYQRDLLRDYTFLMGRIYVEISKSKSFAEVSEARFLHRINELLIINIILAPLSFLFLYIYGFLLSNTTGLRLKKFTDALHKIQAGHYKIKIIDNSQDELGQIAQGINRLTKRLGGK